MNRKDWIAWSVGLAVSASWVLHGCGDDSPGTSGSTASSSGSSGTSTTNGPGPTADDTTNGVASTGSGTTSTGSGADSTGSSSSSGSGSSSSGSGSGSGSGTSTDDGGSSSDESSSSGGGMAFVCPPGGGLPCSSDADCGGDQCYEVNLLGGVCSECNEDADCAWGCSPGNPLTGGCAACCDGTLGCGCETGAACVAGLFCTQLLDVPGIVDISTCSQCQVDGDCMGGDLCSPTYDLNNFRGRHTCEPPGSRADGEGCSLGGSGDAQCASGNCAPTAVMGIPIIGVCSVCNDDADCPGGTTCMLPEVVLGGMVSVLPGACI